MEVTMKPLKRKGNAMNHYTIRRPAGQHLDFETRLLLARKWNPRVRGLDAKLGIRSFAKAMGLPKSTWERELRMGAECATVRDIRARKGNRWSYPEYDPAKAEREAERRRLNKGPRMRMTNLVAREFAELVKAGGLSPYDARCTIVERHPDWHVPCLRSFYNHIEAGDIGVAHGETPYHPGAKRRPRHPPHPAKNLPGRPRAGERPNAANERSEPGHFEMDTVVSGIGGRGGLLVLVDRMTRRYVAEPIGSVNQDEVAKAIGRIMRRRAVVAPMSVTTDNGCEFLDQHALERAFGCGVFYTRAYASWEKGSVENANRMVRRWYPKGTDFSTVPRSRIRDLERRINSIHRKSLGGKTPYDFEAALP